MNTPRSSEPSMEPAPAPAARPRRKRRGESEIFWGRFWLLVTYLVLIVSYVAAIRWMPTQFVDHGLLTGLCGLAILWEGVLVWAVWMRKEWARFLLTGLLIAGIVVFAAVVPSLYMRRPRVPKPLIYKVEICVAMHLAAAVTLIACRPIRRLTSRAHS